MTALTDPTRRAILKRLSRATNIAKPFDYLVELGFEAYPGPGTSQTGDASVATDEGPTSSRMFIRDNWR